MKEMTDNELPKGWVEAPLSDVVDVLDSKRIPLNSDEREQRIKGKKQADLVPYYGATGQVGFIDEALFDEPLILLGEDGVPFFDPSRHKAYRVSGKTWVNNHAHVLRARSSVSDERFITGFLNSFDYTGYVTGSTRLKLTQGSMNSIPVRLAPLAEQKRIADKLEAVLGRVDACRGRLDRVPDLLKRFRQSVLAAATSGQLTEVWRDHNKVPEDWIETPLGTLIADGPKNGLYKASSCYGQGTRILRIDNFYAGFIGAWSGLKRLTVDTAELSDFGLKVGDIVVNRVNSMSHLGKSALVRELPEPCVFESNMMRIRLDVSRLLPEFGILVLTAPDGIRQLQQNAKQAVNQASINQGDVQAVIVPVPSLTEQAEIVRRVEALFALADRIEARLATAQRLVERLTPATLSKAFRGELVPQDPNDEPASVMLEALRVGASLPLKKNHSRRRNS